MTDKELLVYAAKAAGYEHECTSHTGWQEHDKHQIRNEQGTLEDWNPLIDDGDALRLAVTLKLELGFPREAIVWSFGRKGEVCSENYSKDLYSATRRAIVRAAAEIGKEMK